MLARLQGDIAAFGGLVLGRVMRFVQFPVLALGSIRGPWQGYRVLTAQMRESLMGPVGSMAKAVFIVTLQVAVIAIAR